MGGGRKHSCAPPPFAHAPLIRLILSERSSKTSKLYVSNIIHLIWTAMTDISTLLF